MALDLEDRRDAVGVSSSRRATRSSSGAGRATQNCPDEIGPDFDFGNSPILRTAANGRRMIVDRPEVGRGVRASIPTTRAQVLWQLPRRQGQRARRHRVGLGGRRSDVYMPVSDVLQCRTSRRSARCQHRAPANAMWHTPPPPLACKGGLGCTRRAVGAAISVIPGVVFSGVGGRAPARVLDSRDGKIIWEFNTARDFDDRERRGRSRRIDRRAGSDHRRRDGLHRIRVRALARPAGQRAARVRPALISRWELPDSCGSAPKNRR